MLVPTPSTRNSANARRVRAAASAKSGEGVWQTVFASSESKAVLVR